MHGFAAMGRSGPSVVESSKSDALTSDSKVKVARPAGLGGVILGIGEQVIMSSCCILLSVCRSIYYHLLCFWFLYLSTMYEVVYGIWDLCYLDMEVYATGFIPYVGKALNFLLSWMYAYHCFEYVVQMELFGMGKRLGFFETNRAFFAGFGSPCVLAIFFVSPLVSYGVMAILFPLFVLTATGTEAEQVISNQRRWSGTELGKLPVFYAVDSLL